MPEQTSQSVELLPSQNEVGFTSWLVKGPSTPIGPLQVQESIPRSEVLLDDPGRMRSIPELLTFMSEALSWQERRTQASMRAERIVWVLLCVGGLVVGALVVSSFAVSGFFINPAAGLMLGTGWVVLVASTWASHLEGRRRT
jgi:hypothetical protein